MSCASTAPPGTRRRLRRAGSPRKPGPGPRVGSGVRQRTRAAGPRHGLSVKLPHVGPVPRGRAGRHRAATEDDQAAVGEDVDGGALPRRRWWPAGARLDPAHGVRVKHPQVVHGPPPVPAAEYHHLGAHQRAGVAQPAGRRRCGQLHAVPHPGRSVQVVHVLGKVPPGDTAAKHEHAAPHHRR